MHNEIQSKSVSIIRQDILNETIQKLINQLFKSNLNKRLVNTDNYKKRKTLYRICTNPKKSRILYRKNILQTASKQ